MTYEEPIMRSDFQDSTVSSHKRSHLKLEFALKDVVRPDAWAPRTRRGLKDRMIESTQRM